MEAARRRGCLAQQWGREHRARAVCEVIYLSAHPKPHISNCTLGSACLSLCAQANTMHFPGAHLVSTHANSKATKINTLDTFRTYLASKQLCGPHTSISLAPYISLPLSPGKTRKVNEFERILHQCRFPTSEPKFEPALLQLQNAFAEQENWINAVSKSTQHHHASTKKQ